MVQPDKCPCCKNLLHHCEDCWNKYHNGLRDNDYIPPAYYGESMFDLDEWNDRLGRELLSQLLEMIVIKPDKSRLYVEGDYNH